MYPRVVNRLTTIRSSEPFSCPGGSGWRDRVSVRKSFALGIALLVWSCGGPGAETSAPRSPASAPQQEAGADPDEDGLASEADACPCYAEDRDGFEDDDGCPDTDNDQDGVHDACDQCPNEPETYAHGEHSEGCPDTRPLRIEPAAGAEPPVERAVPDDCMPPPPNRCAQ